METTDANTVAEPSAAAEAVEAPKRVQYDSWDERGTPIVSKPPEAPKKPEEPAASAASAKATESEPKGKSAAESEAAHPQEKKERKPGEKVSAEERIAQLTREKKELETRLAERERSREPEPKPAAAQNQSIPPTFDEWKKGFDPDKWIKSYAEQNPTDSYEKAIFAMNEQIDQARQYYRGLETQQQALKAKLNDLKDRYPEAEQVVRDSAKRVFSDPEVPAAVKVMLDESELLPDVLYVLGPKIEEFMQLAKTQPGKALRLLRDTERDIEAELSKPKPKAETKEPPEAKESPEPPKPRAPKPPAEIGGRGTAPEDLAVAAARSGDFAAAEAEWNRRAFARK